MVGSFEPEADLKDSLLRWYVALEFAFWCILEACNIVALKFNYPKTSFGLSLFGFIGAYIVFSVSSVDYEVRHGQVGTIAIGQTKIEVLEALKKDGEWPVHPERPLSYVINSDGSFDFEAPLFVAQAISVSLSYKLFARIEFESDQIARFQFVFPRGGCRDCSESWRLDEQQKINELRELEGRTHIGQSRREFFDQLAAFVTHEDLSVRPEIVELEYNLDFHTPHWEREFDYYSAAYTKHLLSNDEWSFSGFEHLAWYSWFNKPFTSRVWLKFAGGELVLVRHFHAPNELP